MSTHLREAWRRVAVFDPAAPVPMYRGVTLTLAPKQARDLLAAYARSGPSAAVLDMLIGWMAEGVGINSWTGEPNGPRESAGTFWAPDITTAEVYAGMFPWKSWSDKEDVEVPVVLEALIDPEGIGSHWETNLDAGTPLTIVGVEVQLPSQADAAEWVRIYDKQGEWVDHGGWHASDPDWEDPPGAYTGGSADWRTLPMRPMQTVASTVGPLYRGYSLRGIPADLMARLRRLAQPPMEVEEVDQHLGIGALLIEYLQSNHWDTGVGLGRHWSTRQEMAEAATYQGGMRVVLTGRCPESSVIPFEEHKNPGWASSGEDEVTLRPGAPITVTSVVVDLYGVRQGVNVLAAPVEARA